MQLTKILGLLAFTAMTVAVAMNLPDIRRYVRIVSM